MELPWYTAGVPLPLPLRGWWAVELLLHPATLHTAVGCGTSAVHRCTAGGSGLLGHILCIAATHGAVCSGSPAAHCLTTRGSGQWNSCGVLPSSTHELGARCEAPNDRARAPP